MQEFEEALEGCTIKNLKGIGLSDGKVVADIYELFLRTI